MPMMTLDQWKNTRRVDHDRMVVFGKVFNRRTRPRPPYADLKSFDADVMGFQQAQGKWEKITCLGDILADCDQFIRNSPPNLEARYTNAVRALQTSAEDELARLCNDANPPNQISQDVVALARGTALAPKACTIKTYYCIPPGSAFQRNVIDNTINAHLVTANGLFAPAGMQVGRVNAQALPIPANFNNMPVLTNGRFDEVRQSAFVLVKFLNTQGGAAIHVVYVERFADDDVQGFCCRRGNIYSGATADKPIVVVTLTPPGAGAGTYGTTLAHELTHGLTSEGTHAENADSLMAGGANRNGTNDMSLAMLAWVRNNPAV
jgi:hypothetical protein